jgi:hypothetical protein
MVVEVVLVLVEVVVLVEVDVVVVTSTHVTFKAHWQLVFEASPSTATLMSEVGLPDQETVHASEVE